MKARVSGSILVCILLCGLPLQLFAADVTYISDIEYRGTVTYRNAGYEYKYSESHEEKFSALIDEAANITAMEDQLSADLRALLVSEIGSYGDVRLFYFNLDGPIVVELVGAPDGTVTARVGGFSIESLTRVDSYLGTEIQVDINSSVIWLAGDFSIQTGQIGNLRAENFSIDVGVDLDWFLDLIPGFNALVTNKLEDFAEEAAQTAVYDAIGDAIAGQNNTTLFNIDEAIPDGVYVFNGFDVGQQLRELVIDLYVDLVSGESLRIEVRKITQGWVTGRPISNDWPLQFHPGFYDRHRITLNVSDHFIVEVENFIHLTTVYNVFCSWYYCNFPTIENPPNTPKNPSDLEVLLPGETVPIVIPIDTTLADLVEIVIPTDPPPGGGEVVASEGTYGSFVHADCVWAGVSNGGNLNCNGSRVVERRVHTYNFGNVFREIRLVDTANYELEGDYYNFQVTRR